MNLATPQTYTDYYKHSAYSKFVRASRLLGEPPISFTVVEQPAGAFPDPPLPFIAIGIFRRVDTTLNGDLGAGRFRARIRPGAIVVAGLNSATNMVLDGPHSILIAGLSSMRIRNLIPEWPCSISDFGPLHASVLYDPLIEQLCLRLWSEAKAGSGSQLLVDGAIMTLLGCLREYSLERRISCIPGGSGHPSNWRIQRAAEYLRAHLDVDTGLAEVAAVAGVSAFHFARQFKQVFGVSPHRYTIQCRVERARHLLSTTRRSVMSIALDLGFCSPEHFSNTFRRLVGVSPAKYRAALDVT
jgi:AraC family transcriptional regulator